MPRLTADHLVYIDKMWRRLREANLKTMRLDEKWNSINDQLNEYLDAKGIEDAVQRDKIKKENLALADALNAGNWWRAKAVWLSGALMAEKAAVEMTQGSGEWRRAKSCLSSEL
jgi:hypothetical protein